MSSSIEKEKSSFGIQSLLTSQNLVYVGIAWGVISLLFFLLFSISVPGEDSPFWYLVGTYILELIPFLSAAILCFRNWRSPQIASGRNVWLGIGLGTSCWFVGGLLFGWWELYLKLEPDVSPADLFYIVFYLFVSWGMVLAVIPRRLNLEIWQWVTVAAIAVAGIALAIWVFISTPEMTEEANISMPPSAIEQVTKTTDSPQTVVDSKAILVQANPTTSPTTAQPAVTTPVSEDKPEKEPPSWALSLDKKLQPLGKYVNLFYIVGDVFLLVIASTLLLAFWGGRFAQSWRMIAAAAFSLYISDMWFKYVEARSVEYESGGLLEVFFVFSGVLFAIGALLEYDVSSRSRRVGRRRS
ncbi:MAG: hypothetical protein F6K31_23525 [Symploca sp. SIO2G7]|nr:hypothetical protein [Symploca sp. SIO2G7]